jgi:plasmid stabilization system protein ParE
MAARLFLRDEARSDLSETFRWYEGRRPGLGYEFLRAVRVTLAAVERNPRQYPFAVDDIRKAPLRRFPYLVYYVVLEEGTSVLAVMHTRRHPRRWQERR